MGDKYDGVTIGITITEQYIEDMRVIQSDSFNRLYDLKFEPYINAGDADFNKGIEDNSNVFRVIEKKSRTAVDNSGYASKNSGFGDRISLPRIPQLTGNFYLGIAADSATVDLIGNTAQISIKGAAGFENLLSIETGIEPGNEASIEDVESLVYQPSYELGIYFTTVIKKPTVDGFILIGIFDRFLNGFYIGYRLVGEIPTFGFGKVKDGVHDFVPITNFNQDKLDGTGQSGFKVDLTKGNVWNIRTGYLGFAPPSLEIMNEWGTMITAHKFPYPNTSEVTHVSSTYLSPAIKVNNGTAAENVEVKIGSYGAYIVAPDKNPNKRTFSLGERGTLIGFGGYDRRLMIAFRNSGSFQGPLMPTIKLHKIVAILQYLSVTLIGQNKGVLLEILAVPSADVTPGLYKKPYADSVLDYTTDSTFIDINAKVLFATTLGSTEDKIEPPVDKLASKLRGDFHAVFAISSDTVQNIEWVFANAWFENF
jgi:hypothetical protein